MKARALARLKTALAVAIGAAGAAAAFALVGTALALFQVASVYSATWPEAGPGTWFAVYAAAVLLVWLLVPVAEHVRDRLAEAAETAARMAQSNITRHH